MALRRRSALGHQCTYVSRMGARVDGAFAVLRAEHLTQAQALTGTEPDGSPEPLRHHVHEREDLVVVGQPSGAFRRLIDAALACREHCRIRLFDIKAPRQRGAPASADSPGLANVYAGATRAGRWKFSTQFPLLVHGYGIPARESQPDRDVPVQFVRAV